MTNTQGTNQETALGQEVAESNGLGGISQYSERHQHPPRSPLAQQGLSGRFAAQGGGCLLSCLEDLGQKGWFWGPAESCSLGSGGLECWIPPAAWLRLEGHPREVTFLLWERAHRFVLCGRKFPPTTPQTGQIKAGSPSRVGVIWESCQSAHSRGISASHLPDGS